MYGLVKFFVLDNFSFFFQKTFGKEGVVTLSLHPANKGLCVG
jgi:hypothetical protein